jgi:hypothetical protein
MGHERIGALPRTIPWRKVVSRINLTQSSSAELSRIADLTLENVRIQYKRIHEDSGVQAAFGFLISLSSNKVPGGKGLAGKEIDLNNDPSPIRLTAQLNDWVNSNSHSREYAELASRAASDAIIQWTQPRLKQTNLFGDDQTSAEVWNQASNGTGFCEVSRLFFAKFTERYLKYFLDREASSELPSLKARNKFAHDLTQHIDLVSQHAFETSKITQSFAAGWFNTHATKKRPTNREVRNFLSLAFGKLREELKREALRQ